MMFIDSMQPFRERHAAITEHLRQLKSGRIHIGTPRAELTHELIASLEAELAYLDRVIASGDAGGA